MEPTRRHWIVGLDLTERSQGAIRFARWLHEHSRAEERLTGVHVVSATEFQREHPGSGRPLDRARRMAQASADALHAASAFEDFEVVADDSPEDELPRRAEQLGADGLILGRSAGSEGWSLVSLGRVTRRLLRAVPGPTVVVPPDFEVEGWGDGPIVVGVEPTADTVEAVRFGRATADRLGLPLLLAHVVSRPIPAAAADPAIVLALGAQMHRDDGDQPDGSRSEPEGLARWRQEHGFDGLPLELGRGQAGLALLQIADEREATMLVCGSRRLSLSERLLRSSTSRELAAKAARPVAVVPPRAP